jgi:hypothetical protein
MRRHALLGLAALACCALRAAADIDAFAACLADDSCHDNAFANLDASALKRTTRPVVAHCVAGLVRTFSKQTVYEAFYTNLVLALKPVAESDVFPALGKAEYEVRPANAAGWLAAFSSFNVVGASLQSAGDQRTKLDSCFTMLLAAEAAHGRQYTHVLRSRPDVLWLRPVPASLASTAVVMYQYDIAGMCPRAAVTPDWPCDVPNSAHDATVGPHNVAADPHTDAVFQLSFERVNEPITQLERHFEWMAWFRDGLAERLKRADPAPPPPHVLRSILVNYYASMCFKYDFHLHNYIYYSVQSGDDFVPEYAPTCMASELAASRWMAALQAVGEPAKLADVLKSIEFGPIVGHYVQHDFSAPRGPNVHFDTLCGCRWSVCGAKQTAGLAEEVVTLTRALCKHHFATPFNARQYYYHPPALHPQFDERDFVNTSFADVGPPGAPPGGLRIAVLVVGQMKPNNQNALTLESLRARVIDPYRRDGHVVDTFLCETLAITDRASTLVLTRLRPYTVFDVEAANQFDRNEACYKRVLETHAAAPYDWYVRVRPDLVLWDDAPAPESLDAGAIHARLLSAQNMPGVKQGTMSYAFDDPKCNHEVCLPGTCSTLCEVYDDEFAIVPAAMAEAYFAAQEHKTGVEESRECHWTRNGFPEGFFTRAVMRGGGRFKPLTLESRLFMYKGDVPDEAARDVEKNC